MYFVRINGISWRDVETTNKERTRYKAAKQIYQVYVEKKEYPYQPQ